MVTEILPTQSNFMFATIIGLEKKTISGCKVKFDSPGKEFKKCKVTRGKICNLDFVGENMETRC